MKYISHKWTEFIWRKNDTVLTFYKYKRNQLIYNMYKLVVLSLLSKIFLLHETFTYILIDMTKDFKVPFVPSKTYEI